MQLQVLALQELQEELKFAAGVPRPVRLLMPPSFLISIRRSPFVRFLVVIIDADSDARNPDYTESLSAEENLAMDAKAAALGQAPFFGPDTDETRDYQLVRIFFYGLSLMPCTSQLELIEDCSSHVSMIEMFTLFPSFRSYVMCPPYQIDGRIETDRGRGGARQEASTPPTRGIHSRMLQMVWCVVCVCRRLSLTLVRPRESVVAQRVTDVVPTAAHRRWRQLVEHHMSIE
jgi:hypothetical protein